MPTPVLCLYCRWRDLTSFFILILCAHTGVFIFLKKNGRQEHHSRQTWRFQRFGLWIQLDSWALRFGNAQNGRRNDPFPLGIAQSRAVVPVFTLVHQQHIHIVHVQQVKKKFNIFSAIHQTLRGWLEITIINFFFSLPLSYLIHLIRRSWTKTKQF